MSAKSMSNTRRMIALALTAGVFIMEGYDINAMALAVPRLQDGLGLAPTAFGWVFSAIVIGIGVGGAIFAPLGDRIGRRPLIVFGCLGVAAATFMTASSTGITEFLIWRGLTGFALGACLPNCSALAAELAPPRLRATVMAVVSAGIPLGLAIAGMLAPEVIKMAGWQGLFYVPGALSTALALGMFVMLDPGPPTAREDEDAPTRPASKLPQVELFKAPWLLPFGVVAAILSLNAMNLYYLNSWIPTVLPQAGFSLDLAARIAGVVQLAGLAIGIGTSLLIDRWRPGAALVTMFGAMALCFALVGLTAPETTRWTLLLMVGVGGASAGGMVLPSLCAYLFPPHLLSSAIGMGILVARIGAIAGPPLGELFLRMGTPPDLFLSLSGVPALLCALIALAVPAALAVRQRLEASAAAGPA